MTRGTHPLIAAVIKQLPAQGTDFPATARVAWLKMMVQSFDLAYGPGGAISVNQGEVDAPMTVPLRSAAAPTAPAPAPRKPHAAAGCDFYVDLEGFARCDHSNADGVSVPTPERRVSAEEAADHEIYDYRGARRDRDTVKWADDSVGALPGMTFCGPG